MKQDLIVILDLGSTQNTVIARDIRDLGVYSEIHPHDITVDEVKALQNVKGIVLNGGENRVVDGQEVEQSSGSGNFEEIYLRGVRRRSQLEYEEFYRGSGGADQAAGRR